MTGANWRMTVYDLAAGAHCTVAPGGNAFIYAAASGAVVSGKNVEPGQGAFAKGGAAVSASGLTWIFEIAPGALPARRDEGLSPVLSRLVPSPDSHCMIRADRVEAPAGAETPAHHHRGPGIRRLESGLLLAEVGDHLDRIEAGQAWFESGCETVVGLNISGGVNAFIRVMLLPMALAGGKSSFVPATPDEAAKPRIVTLTIFGEQPL